MNRYNIEISAVIEATNQEAAEDIIRDILESEPEIVSFDIEQINDATAL